MTLYHKGIPIAWNNFALFHFAEATHCETIEGALTNIVDALQSFNGRKPKITPQGAMLLGRMFEAAIEAGYFSLQEKNTAEKNLAFDFVTDAEAISKLMNVFTDSMPNEQKKK